MNIRLPHQVYSLSIPKSTHKRDTLNRELAFKSSECVGMVIAYIKYHANRKSCVGGDKVVCGTTHNFISSFNYHATSIPYGSKAPQEKSHLFSLVLRHEVCYGLSEAFRERKRNMRFHYMLLKKYGMIVAFIKNHAIKKVHIESTRGILIALFKNCANFTWHDFCGHTCWHDFCWWIAVIASQ